MFNVLSLSANCQVLRAVLLAALTFGSGAALAAGDAAAGKTKAAACAGCHGTDGKATIAEYPNLAGQHADYIAKQLEHFKSGERANAIMAGMAAALSAQDMADIGAFYAGLTPIAGVANKDGLQQGQDIYRGGITDVGVPACSGCHGATGNGNPAAGFPALAGQNAAYTVLQLQAFRSKDRANDANAMMRGVAERLTDAEIDAVANYISGLH